MCSRSGLFRSQVFKVRVVSSSCLQGQDCLEVMSSRLGLFRGHVFTVKVLDIISSKSVFKEV